MRLATLVLGLAVLALSFPQTATAQLVTAPGQGCPSQVQLIDSTGTRTFQPYDPRFLGGISVAMGDVNGDGVADIITGAGATGGPHVAVFSGTDLSVLASFFAYDPTFTGGVQVAAGDVNGDGHADIITGPGFGGSSHVAVFSGADLSVLASFFAYDPQFKGGVQVAAGDVNGDGLADIITGAGRTGSPHVAVFSGADLSVLASFFAYNPAFTGGIYVAAGDVNGDGLADIITGPQPGGSPHVAVFSGADGSVLASFFAFDPVFMGGVSVATGDLNADGRVDLIMGSGQGAPPYVRIISGLDGSELPSIFPSDQGCGVFVASVGDAGGVRFTSPATASFSVGTAGNFTVTTAGNPVPALSVTGTLPTDVTFVDNGDGTATLEGTPAADTGGEYPLTFTADNGTGAPATQTFTLLVMQPPAVTSSSATTFTVGAGGSFTVTTTGFPVPTLTAGGVSLPAGVTFVDNGDGTGTLSGTPPASAAGTYALTFTATNGVGTPIVQAFTLTLNGAPSFTSAAATTFTVGSAGTFTVTTMASPTAALTLTGTLPSGVTFVDNGDGTAALTGTPAVGTGATYPLTITATNGIPPTATQNFSLTISEGPVFTSASSTTFTIGSAGTFTVTTSGEPDVATITIGGAVLPAGVTFVNNGDGTATLGGTPGAGTGGTYALTFTANNGVGGNVVQNFTLNLNGGPAITSATATTFTVGSAGSFSVTTTGTPTPALSVSGALPAGVTFVDNGNGTGTLSGTPGAATGGAYALTFTAANGILPNATQSFTLNVNQAPAITSANNTTLAIGTAGSFTVTTSGFPAPALALGGVALPAGVTFVDNGNGTGTLGGTPAAGTGGDYAITFTATNVVSASAPQAFTLTVNSAPTISSANTTTFTVGSLGSFTVTTTGSPTPALSVTGALPSGVTFVDNGDGTGTLSGTPAAGTGGAYSVTFTAANSVLPNGTQAFTLNVNQAPVITSAASATFIAGTAGSFTVTTSGFPAPAVTIGGVALPSGVTFADNGNGTGTLAGTPAAGTGGSYAITFTATNVVSATAPQAFTLTVNQAPAITSAATTTFTVGVLGSFTVTTTGFPMAAIARTGVALPGGVTFVDNLNGTGTLSGTPAAGTAGSYAISFTAANGVPSDAVQPFTLNVHQAPAITSTGTTTFTVGTPGTFSVTTTGFPTPTVSQTGTLPTGVTFTPATRVLGGTATQTGVFPLVFTATNGVSPDATQNFTLNVVCPAITVTPLVLPDGLYQTAYGPVDFNQTGSTGSTFVWSATGLPTGFTFDINTGVVAGTPTNTVAGGAVGITVTDNFGCTGTVNTTLTVRPVADNEIYNGGVGNTQYVVGAAVPTTPNVFENDNVKTGDSGPGALAITFPATSTSGVITEGTTDGTFTYTPNLGFAGPTDSFTYTLTDGNGVTNTGTVTINLSGVVWYVNSSGGNGDGRSHNPFNALNNAATPSLATHTIYVHTGGATTPGNLAMDATQTLRGQGTAFSLNNLTIAAGTRPTLSGTVTLANTTAAMSGVNFTPSGIPALVVSGATTASIDQVNVTGGTSALSLTSVTGAVTVTNAIFTNTSAAEVLISGGTGNVTVSAAINSNAGRSIDIQNRTGGIVTFNGAITDTGQGIFLNLNTGSTINFTGGLALTTTTNPGFTATGGGTVSATQNNTTIVNTITTTTGTALNVANTTIGASGLTFRSVAAGTGASGPTNAIVLNTTGAVGGLTITGTGTAGSGGTIQRTTGVGILLTSTSNVSLSSVNLTNSGDDGIRGQGVQNFGLIGSNLTTNGNATAENGLQFGEPSGSVAGITGTLTLTNTNITGSAGNNVHIRNTSGTLTSMAVSGSTFNDLNDTTGANSFLFETSGTAITTLATITNSTFQNNSPQRALEVQAHETGTITKFTVQNCAFIDNGIHASFTQDLSSSLTFNFLNNGTAVTPMTGSILQAVNVFSSSQSTGGLLRGRIENNFIGNAAVLNSGSTGGGGISAVIQGQTDATLSIDGNTIRQTSGDARAIAVAVRGPANPLAGTLGANTVVSDITITNNNVIPGAAPSGFPLSTISIEADNQTGADNKAPTVRADIRGNTVPATPVFDFTSAHIQFYEYDAIGGHGIGQLVNTSGAATANQQLSNTNTGSVDSFGIALIAGPIEVPPAP